MKRNFMLALCLCTMGTVLFAGIHYGRKVEAMTTPVYAKGQPANGLVLAPATDTNATAEVAGILAGKSSPAVENLKPFSVVLKNTGTKSAVAYRLVWEFVTADGATVTHQAAFSNPRALMDGSAAGQEAGKTAGLAIAPGASRLFSPLLSLGKDDSPESGIGAYSLPMIGALSEPEKQAFASGNRDAISAVLRDQLAKCKSVTVSLDGAFFDDGTFVGPNATDYFSVVKAQQDAKRDLLQEISNLLDAKNPKASYGAVFSHVGQVAQRTPPAGAQLPPPAQEYNRLRKAYAEEILRMQKALGDEQALAYALEPFRSSWVTLRKQ